MAFFRRRQQQPESGSAESIGEFWVWWLGGARERAAAAFDGQDPALIERIGEETARRVAAVSADLAFEYGAGRTARHCLTVTAAGDPEARPVADRWLAAAPGPDDAFEYDAWRRAHPDPGDVELRFGDAAVDLASVRVLHAPQGDRTGVVLHHPAFAGLPDDAQGQITFLLLDVVLGERLVETRIGAVSWSAAEPVGAVPLLDLVDVVA